MFLRMYRQTRPLLFSASVLVLLVWLASRASALAGSAPDVNKHVYLPVVRLGAATCQPIAGASYGTITPLPPPTDRPAEVHADLNLALRSYAQNTNAFLGFTNYGPTTDPAAPQLPGLFSNNRTPVFSRGYQIHHWDWGCNCRGPLIDSPGVTLLGMATTAGETIHVPASGYQITAQGHEVLVLYAAANRITLKYTAEDNVIFGYTIHIENVCVEPRLLALYQASNANGRSHLPALHAGDPLGRAMGGEIRVAIRDTGAFMDPRSRNDWWIGR